MNNPPLLTIKWGLVLLVTLAIWSLLLWQYSHDGVPSHYFLQRADMPELSNWWGGLLLPFLTWLALSRIQKRLLTLPEADLPLKSKQILISFIIALGYGAALAIAFTQGRPEISGILFPAILLFALFFKVYREEFVLGFILSMSITFGAILPTIFAAAIALASWLVYFLAQFIYRKIKNVRTTEECQR